MENILGDTTAYCGEQTLKFPPPCLIYGLSQRIFSEILYPISVAVVWLPPSN